MTDPQSPTERPPVAARFLIDNSVWQRQRQPAVHDATARLMAAHPPWSILTCPPVVAEVGFSARSGTDHDTVRQSLTEFPECETHPSVALVLDIQNAIFYGGLVRAVGATDTVIAAYAVANDATVVHYDGDFEHVAHVWPGFRHAWIAPRGSLDEPRER